MIRKWLIIAAGISVCASAVGCGNAPGKYSVEGKVLFKGEPAAGAVVYFHPQGSAAQTSMAVPFGIVGDDGGFSLTYDGVGNGCPAGQYDVLVEWRDKTGDGVVPVKAAGKTDLVKRSRVRSGPDRLNGRYLNIKKPLIHREVLPQANMLAPIELSD